MSLIAPLRGTATLSATPAASDRSSRNVYWRRRSNAGMILGGMDPVLIGIVVVLLLFVFFVFLFLRRTAKAFKEGYE